MACDELPTRRKSLPVEDISLKKRTAPALRRWIRTAERQDRRFAVGILLRSYAIRDLVGTPERLLHLIPLPRARRRSFLPGRLVAREPKSSDELATAPLTWFLLSDEISNSTGSSGHYITGSN